MNNVRIRGIKHHFYFKVICFEGLILPILSFIIFNWFQDYLFSTDLYLALRLAWLEMTILTGISFLGYCAGCFVMSNSVHHPLLKLGVIGLSIFYLCAAGLGVLSIYLNLSLGAYHLSKSAEYPVPQSSSVVSVYQQHGFYQDFVVMVLEAPWTIPKTIVACESCVVPPTIRWVDQHTFLLSDNLQIDLNHPGQYYFAPGALFYGTKKGN